MKWNTLCYLFKQGIIGLWRNRTMALASIGTIILCLMILGSSYTLGVNIDYMIEQVQAKFGITTYLKDNLEPSQIEILKANIEKLATVKSVTYISKEEALKTFSEENGDSNLFSMFKTDNPMPASLEIMTYSMADQPKLVEQLKQYAEIEDTVYFKDETQGFIKMRDTVNYVCLSMLILFVIVGLMLMSNTIKLTVYVRRKEINIMKYVGATDIFIQIPFFIEGIMIGLIGALLSIAMIAGAYQWIVQQAISSVSVLGGIVLLPEKQIVPTVGWLFIILGVGIGCIGSIVAIHRHLKV